MLIVEEYLAVQVLVGDIPEQIDPDETFGSPTYRHHRLLQRVHTPGGGQLSTLLSGADQSAIRRPDPEVLQIIDPSALVRGSAQREHPSVRSLLTSESQSTSPNPPE